jgi:putative FmdB family regulatory protein
MPLYEYECQKCGKRFELRRAIEESDAQIECPGCGAKHPTRLFSSFAAGPSGDSSCRTSGST